MSNRRDVDPRPTTTPMLDWWPGAVSGASRRDLEHARWRRLGHTRTYVDVPGRPQVQVGPMLRQGEDQCRLAHVRCEGCGDRLGEIFSVPREWQGRPFTWAECWWITDRETRPPRMARYMTILDDWTASGVVEAECPIHGVVSVNVREILTSLPALADRLNDRRRPSKVIARRIDD